MDQVADAALIGAGVMSATLGTLLRQLDPSLSYAESNLRRVYKDPVAIDHILDGLRKAGWREE